MNETRPSPGHPRPVSGTSYGQTLRRLRGSFLLVGVFSAIINILMLTGPLYMLQVYDRVLSSGSVATLQGLFLIVIVLYVFMGLYEFLRSRLLARAAMRLDREVGPAAFRAWLHSGRQGQEGSSLPLRDLETLRAFLSGPTMGSIFDLPWIPLYLGLLFLIHPLLGWLTLAGAGIVGLAALANRRLTRAPQETAALIEGEARNFAEHGRRNAELVEAMGMERHVVGRWWQSHGRSLASGQRASDISETTGAFSKAFRLLLQSTMLTLGALLVLREEMSAGMIIASSILSGRALAPIDQIIAQWRLIGNASLAHRRLGQFFAGRPQGTAHADLPAPTGSITATRLTCLAAAPANAPPGAERARMLNEVGFTLAPGDGLGVIGNSAAGKSTLARLIVGAWRPEMGEVRFDGATRDQWNPEVLGRATGYLPQVVELMPGTIRDNITRFDPQARDEDMIEAAKLAGVHEMILALPEGYGTQVGQPGQPLSGGQVQRVGLVRAIYGRPRIIVLDEPNSNLDAAGEAALARVIRSLREGGSTVILMTHRTSALAEMNKLMLLSNGKVMNFGERDEVLRSLMRPVPSSTPGEAAAAEARQGASVATMSADGAVHASAAEAARTAVRMGMPMMAQAGTNGGANPLPLLRHGSSQAQAYVQSQAFAQAPASLGLGAVPGIPSGPQPEPSHGPASAHPPASPSSAPASVPPSVVPPAANLPDAVLAPGGMVAGAPGSGPAAGGANVPAAPLSSPHPPAEGRS